MHHQGEATPGGKESGDAESRIPVWKDPEERREDQMFDAANLKYPSARYPLFSDGGMVNASTPQAAAAGIEMLRKGGNAMEAAVAAAAALTVVEPTANGLGSDAFALIWSEKDHKLFGLNASGYAPALATGERILADHRDEKGKMPKHGWTPVTVPGAVSAWSAIRRRFGCLSMTELLSPAIHYAAEGYPLGAAQAGIWNRLGKEYRKTLKGPQYEEWFKVFWFGTENGTDGGKRFPGERIRLPLHAQTLEKIAGTDGESFYRGDLAKIMDAQSRKYGGLLRRDDLEQFIPEWVEPVSVNYRGYDVCEIPPNGQGMVALMALNILNHVSLGQKDDPLTWHRQLEAMKLAFSDGLHYITEPGEMRLDYHSLLTKEYGASRAALIGKEAQVYSHGTPPEGGTVYLCTADAQGNMVSYIQSNYNAFGSGIVVAGTGIALQNRGSDFSLDPDHANYIRPHKRTYHTIIPGFLMKDGEPVGPFGVMGGYMQPQGHVQTLMNRIDFHMNPQQALDAPRWMWQKEKTVWLEKTVDKSIAEELSGLGHDIRIAESSGMFGKGQIIQRMPDGILCGGTEPRYDSNIALL